MADVIQSAGGIVYYLDKDHEPHYLLIKRHALSGKIEWVAPKGKIQGDEAIEKTALREVSEETAIPINQLKLKQNLGVTQIRNLEHRWPLDKDVTYFLMEFIGDPGVVSIDQIEGYVGIHKWATLQEVLGLIYYQDIRELMRKSHHLILQQKKNTSVKEAFLAKLD